MPCVKTLVFLSISIAIFAIPFSPQRYRGTENCEKLRNAKNNEGVGHTQCSSSRTSRLGGELIRSQAFLCVSVVSLSLGGRDPLLRGFGHVIGGNDRQSGIRKNLSAEILVGTLHAHH